MKGTVFVELLKMAEDAFGEEVVDTVLDKADLEMMGPIQRSEIIPVQSL